MIQEAEAGGWSSRPAWASLKHIARLYLRKENIKNNSNDNDYVSVSIEIYYCIYA